MRLWIDGQCLQTASNLRGIGRYVFEFIRSISTYHPEVELLVSFNAALPDTAIAGREQISKWVKPENIFLWQGIAESGEIESGYSQSRQLSELALAHHVACLQPNVALSASPFEGFADVAVPFTGAHGHPIPTAAIFYDAIPYRFPDRYLTNELQKKCYVRRLNTLRNFDKLLTISSFSTKEATGLVETPTAEIDAGISPEFLSLASQSTNKKTLNQLALGEHYLLYVGAMDWRKNVPAVVQAFTSLPEKIQSSLKFIIAGDSPKTFKEQIFASWNELNLPEKNLLMLGHVTDATLVELYKHARVVIQPSLMEGFGLTALEAMVCGAPVIAAKAGALPEVVGNELALFNPEDPVDIAKAIRRTIEDKEISQTLSETGLNQAQKYTWKRTASLAIAALKEISKRSGGNRTTHLYDEVAINQARAITENSVTKQAFDIGLAANILAAAEPALGTPRLLIDVTSTAIQDHATGIQRVVKNICTSLVEQSKNDNAPELELGYCDSKEGFFRAEVNSIGKIFFHGKKQQEPIRFAPGGHLLMLDSSWEYYISHAHIFKQARLAQNEITTVLYDLVPLQVPAFCHSGMPPIFASWLKGALARSTGFLCISKAVADDLLKLLHAIQFPRPLKIGYWHLGADLPSSPSDEDSTIKKYGKPMFLMVGTLEPRKGYGVALEAFTQLWKNGFKGNLYLAGKRGWGVDHLIKKMTQHPEYGKKLHWIEGPSDAELQTLYKSCDALIASSYAEGFGLPIVEAALHNKPVIASDIPVFREVAGKSSATIFFETGSSTSLTDAIKDFLENQENWKQKSRNSNSWITWNESAKQLKEVVTKGNWYYKYQPQENVTTQMTGSIGVLETTRELLEEECKFELKLIEGPIPSDDNGMLKFIIRIRNKSNTYWSSDGVNGRYAIKLGYHIIGRNAIMLQQDNPRTSFPIGIPPHTDHYASVEVGAGWLLKGMTAIEFELVQEGVRWWGSQLLVNLEVETKSKQAPTMTMQALSQ